MASSQRAYTPRPPQVYKAHRTKSTGDLSWCFLATYTLGLVLLGT